MCGIVGCVGKKQAAPILLDGLEKLEYRGYDSAGIAVCHDGALQMTKSAGRIKTLRELTHEGAMMPGTIGIGHTRWAMHGVPSDVNAHPHFNEDESIAIVHNGIIENYEYLKNRLKKKGYHFRSDTDTEVVAYMLDYYRKDDPIETIISVMNRLEGSYALGIIFKDEPDKLFAVRKNSPLIAGKGEDGNYIASDASAILRYTRNVYFLENHDIAVLTENSITFYNMDKEVIEKECTTIDWDVNAAEKGGFDHFMLKEIHEQPQSVRDTLHPKTVSRIKGKEVLLEELNFSDEFIRNMKKIVIVACGSACHVGHTLRYVIEGMARIPVEVELASEFRYRDPIVDKDTLVVVISQSGETADTLEGLREAKKRGCPTLAIVNVVGSSIAREADQVFYTWTGPEIAVATTKAYSAQLVAGYLLAIRFAYIRRKITKKEMAAYVADLEKLPEQIEMLIENKKRIQRFANRYVAAKNVFFIGRGIDYAISMEGSLKLKEISYIPSEAYAAGELKHGTISLIEEGTLVASVMTQEKLISKTLSNVEEVQTRGAFVLAVVSEGHKEVEKVADYVIYIPKTNEYFANSLAIIPLQLFSYYVALGKGCDVDKPRNLAKSVTVE